MRRIEDSRMKRKCKVCGEELVGRSDKKFCSSGCRSYYNNLKNRKSTKYTKKNKHIQSIIDIILSLEKRGAKFSIKFIYGSCTLFKILTNFRKN